MPRTSSRPAPRRLYPDAAYDPAGAAASWWAASAPPAARTFPPLEGETACDVAVIGAGYTGLNAALVLARDYGADVRVLDRGEPGSGASGRNGGFCCVPGTKLPLSTLVRRYGEAETRRFLRAQMAAIDHVRDTLDALGVDADATSRQGELQLAHSPGALAAFAAEAAEIESLTGLRPTIWPKPELRQFGADGPDFHGAALTPLGFALHPLKYLRGLAEAAAAAGARLHARSEAHAFRREAGRHVIETSRGRLMARRLIVATNGYGSEDAPRWLAGRVLPALSSILVTRPITEAEAREQSFTTDAMSFDTRTLLHYFRRLPDGRFLFGGRGGTDGTPEGAARWRRRLRREFERMFPAWSGVETTHEWSGFVALSRARTPYLGRLGDLPDAWTALAFHGNGVATGSWSGAMLARLATGAKTEAEIPAVFRTPLRRFPLPSLRRLQLAGAYALYGLRDRLY